jgi:hypothetical protein
VLLLRYLDVALVVVAAPVMLLIGVSAVGYAAGGGVWIALRAVGLGVDRAVAAIPEMGRKVTLQLTFLLTRLVLLALTVIFVRKGSGQGAGLAALSVIVFAYTVSLVLSFVTRPKSQ